MAASSFFAILLLAAPFLLAKAEMPCPFNPSHCNCSTIIYSYWPPNSFGDAECDFGETELNFLAPNGTYNIFNELRLHFNAYNIKARSFVAFESIKMLKLFQSPTAAPVKANWDAKAFEGPRINGLVVSNVSGVIPPPAALKEIAADLEQLSFYNCREQVNLGPNAFSYFTNLQQLRIQDTPINPQIDGAAFAGLQDNLTEIYLVNTSLTSFPSVALSPLTNLYRLDVGYNGMQKFSANDFVSFKHLVYLTLKGNNVKAAYDSGALDSIQMYNGYLYLEQGNLESIPTRALSNPSTNLVQSLSLQDNQIRALKKGDFPKGIMLGDIDLSGNPITTIEKGVMQDLKRMGRVVLKRTALVSVDLSAFKGINEAYLIFDDSQQLTSLTVSNTWLFQVPYYAYVSATNTSLQVIDPKIGRLLDHIGGWSIAERFDLDISDCTNLDCNQDLTWMAKYVLCQQDKLRARNAKCSPASGGANLEDHLKKIAPNACHYG